MSYILTSRQKHLYVHSVNLCHTVVREASGDWTFNSSYDVLAVPCYLFTPEHTDTILGDIALAKQEVRYTYLEVHMPYGVDVRGEDSLYVVVHPQLAGTWWKVRGDPRSRPSTATRIPNVSEIFCNPDGPPLGS